jgi:ABC-type polysaccharide/polyol phosphate export permease
LLQYGIFVSGVIFPIGASPILQSINRFNPFAVYIDASRGVVFSGAIDDPLAFAGMSAAAVVMLLLACRIFYVMERRVRGVA